MTEKPHTCSRCGETLSEDAAGGLCPRCLMAMNFDSRTMPEGEELPHMAPFSPEELAEKFPQYEILECLGRGGMGVVYKARQKSLDRIVAIKILPPERVGEAKFSERFAIEAATLAKLSHPNIVTVHDFGIADSQPSTHDSQPLYYIVMEYVDGVNLRDLLREGKLEPQQALAIVPPICDALQYAHDKGIVHRDIKPENLLLDKDGRLKIADFGIASLMGAAGEVAGTPPYMAPEQNGAKTDHRADIYALGVVLYEMLTGERPGKELIAPSRKVQIDVRLDEMVLRALEKEPERRYQTAGEFRTVVETIHASPPPMQPMAAVPPQKPPGMSRRWWWVFPMMVPVSVMLALMAGMVFNYVVPKKYEALATIQIRAADGSGSMPPGFLAIRMEKLRSNQSLADVSARLELPKRWMLADYRVIPILKTIVGVQNLRGTDLVSIKVRHTSPQDAVDIADAVVRAAQADPEVRLDYIEKPMLPAVSVSPNLFLNLVLAGAVGLFASPLLGWILATLLHRLIPVRPIAGSGDGVPARVQAASNQQAPVSRDMNAPSMRSPERTQVEETAASSGRRKQRRKKFSFRLHDRTPSKAALLGVAALCLFVGCLIPVVGEPLWRLFSSGGGLNEVSSPYSPPGFPVWMWGLFIGVLLVFVTMVFSLVLVFRSNGSGAAKFLAAFVLLLLFGGTMAVLVAAGLYANFTHQRDVSREMMRHEMQRTFTR